MRIIFMGTPGFAVASLKALSDNGFEIAAVVTTPDKPAGRGQQVSQSEVKKFAVERGFKVLQPEKLKDPAFNAELEALRADLQVVVAFRMLPEAVWNMPRLGTINLHASLLPRYRGAAPINWAIINGEKESGVTTFKLKHEIDTGNILFSRRVPVSEAMTAGELHDTLMETGAGLLLETVREIERCDAEGIEPAYKAQENTGATHAPKIFRDTCRIDWNKPAQEIFNLVRGLSPYPAAFTQIRNGNAAAQTLKIYGAQAEMTGHDDTNGSLVTDNKTYLKVRCGGGLLSLTDVQVEGKRRMGVEDFLRGYRVEDNAVLV